MDPVTLRCWQFIPGPVVAPVTLWTDPIRRTFPFIVCYPIPSRCDYVAVDCLVILTFPGVGRLLHHGLFPFGYVRLLVVGCSLYTAVGPWPTLDYVALYRFAVITGPISHPLFVTVGCYIVISLRLFTIYVTLNHILRNSLYPDVTVVEFVGPLTWWLIGSHVVKFTIVVVVIPVVPGYAFYGEVTLTPLLYVVVTLLRCWVLWWLLRLIVRCTR